MTAPAARGSGASRTDRQPDPSARPARAGLSNPFRFFFAARLPRFGVRGGLAAALVLLALSVLAPAGPAQAQITGLTVSPRVGGLYVTWNAYSGSFDNYVVRWRSGQSFTSANTRSKIVGTSTTITDLTPGTQYTVHVSAHDGNGEIANSAATATATPAVQKVTLIPSIEGNKLRAIWRPVAGASFYDVSAYPGTSTTAFKESTFRTAPPYEYTLEGLVAGTEYRVEVVARNSGGTAIAGATADENGTPLLPPVTNLSIRPKSSTSLEVKWNPVSGANRYDVNYRVAGSTGSWQTTTQGTATSKTITSLTADTNYAVRVRAWHSTTGAESIWRGGFGATSGVAGPSGLSAYYLQGDRSSSVSLDWTPYFGTNQNPTTRFFVNYYSASDVPGEVEGDDVGTEVVTGRTAFNHHLHGLRPGTTYTFRVQVQFKDGTLSPYSNTVTWTTAAATAAPGSPRNVKASVGVSDWHRTSLTWDRPSSGQGVEGYEIEFQTSGGSWTDLPVGKYHDPAKSLNTAIGHGELSPSTSYRYRVRAVNKRGNSSWVTSGWVTTYAKPVEFHYEVADVVIDPDTPGCYSRWFVTLPELLDGYDPVANATYALTVAGGGGLPRWVSYNAATRLVTEHIRTEEVTISGGARKGEKITTRIHYGGIHSELPLTLVWKATHPNGTPYEQSFTLSLGDGSDACPDDGGRAESGPDTNRSPAFERAPTAQTATEGKAFSYEVPEATDYENDAIVYTAALSDGSALPDWLTFNASTRILSGTPGAGDAPAALDIEVLATDDADPPLSRSATFTLTVKEAGAVGDGAPQQAPPHRPTPPTANAGADLEGKRGGEVTLSGSGTLNAQGSQDALAYSWRIADASHAELKSGTSWLSNKTQATATYSVPRRKDMTDRKALDNGQSVTFELTVTDGDGETATDRVTMTIRGSTWKVVNLSVADATAEESSGSIAFTVSLSAASRDPVTVDYATSNGTAVAGTDYTATSGTLTFAKGETSKTVTVPILDDAHDEATETFTLTLSNPSPAKTTKIADATATGSISNADPLQQDWLARFGRAAASDAIAAITARLETPRSAASHLTVGGHRLPFGGSANPEAAPSLPPVSAGGPGGPSWLSWSGDPNRGLSGDGTRGMSERELLMGTSFRAVLGNGAGAQWTGWGQGASVSRFSSGTPGLSLSGETATGSMGMDYERGRLLTGFAMTHSLGEGTAHGAGRSYVMGSSVTTVLPYARLGLTDRVSVWGLAGTGSGRLTLDLDGGATERYGTDLSMTLAAMGVRGELLTPAEAGGFALALKADAFWVRTESERVSAPGVGNLASARADASRMRAVLDGSRTFMLAGGATLTPSVELGVRHDGGDAETGTGMELGAGVGYADPSRGLDMALRVHGLAAHAERGYSDWSVSGSLRFVPGGAGRGLSMSLTPSYGADPGGANPGGAQRLWMQPDAHALAANDDAEPSSRLDAEVGYGMAMFDGGFTGTPHVGFGLSETARELRMGWRLSPAGTGYGGFEFSLDAARREAANEDTPEHRIGFGITARW